MKINIYKLQEQMLILLSRKGFSDPESKILMHAYWNAELEGKTTHGISRFYWDIQNFHPKRKPKIVIDKKAVVLVDGQHGSGPLIANYASDMLIKRAKNYGIALVGIKNMTQYGSLSEWTEKIAKKNLIGLITNSCQPAAAPFGGVSKILGTNPISISIPSDEDPIILDMSTSEVPMGLIWYCLETGKKLPKHNFYDEDGKFTTDPKKAKAVKTFGGYKGYGLSFMLQILSGSLVSAFMGDEIKNAYDIGYMFLAIDPSFFQNLDTFKQKNSTFIKQIKNCKKNSGVDQILIPGERSLKNKKTALKDETIDIPEAIWSKLNEKTAGTHE